MTLPPAEPWDLVVFSDDWGRRPSAPQHLGARLARGRRILWVEPAGLRKPRATRGDLRRGLQKLRGFVPGGAPSSDQVPWLATPPTMRRLVPPVVPAYGVTPVRVANDALVTRAVRAAMAEEGITQPVLLTTIPTMAGVVGSLGERAAVYLRVDDFSLWSGYDAGAIAEREALLCQAADAVVAPGAHLLEGLGAGRTAVIPHGVDHEHFARPSASDPLEDLPRPRVLVAGRLDERLDAGTLTTLAREGDLQLVLLGEAVAVPEELRGHPRVHLRPAVSYGALPSWLQAADVLLVPYAANPLGHSLAPLKTRELLATGRPVVASALRGTADDVELVGLVRLAATPEEMIAQVRAALAETPEEGRARQVSTAGMTWEARARALEALVGEVLATRAARPAPV